LSQPDQPRHDGQQPHRQDVIHDGGTQDRHPHPALRAPEIAKGPHGEAHAGGREGGPEEEPFMPGEPREEPQGQSADEGQEHTAQGRHQRPSPRLPEILRIRLQTGQEHEEQHAEEGRCPELLPGMKPAHAGWAQEEPRQELPEHRRQSQAGAKLSPQSGAEEDERQPGQHREFPHLSPSGYRFAPIVGKAGEAPLRSGGMKTARPVLGGAHKSVAGQGSKPGGGHGDVHPQPSQYTWKYRSISQGLTWRQ